MALPVLAVGDVLMVSLRGRLHGQRTVNTFFYLVETVPGGDSTGGFQALATAFDDSCLANLVAMVSDEQFYDAIRVRRIEPGETSYVDFLTLNDQGMEAEQALPSTVALVLSKRNLEVGPSHRGRVYISGLPVTHEEDSTLAPGVRAAWLDMANNFFSATLSDGGFDFIPVHYRRAGGGVPETIDVISLDINLANQRRRRVGRGE